MIMNAPQRNPVRAAFAYAGMVAGAVGLFLLIRRSGEMLSAADRTASARLAAAGPAGDTFWHLLVALAAVVIIGRSLGRVFRKIHQPPVIGEVVGGVLLGPSLLGAISPSAYHFILPPSVVPSLAIVSQLGVMLYMFLIGVELNPNLLRGQVHATVATSHASIVLPFVLGAGLALFLYPRFSTSDVQFTSFALFLGIAMSVTAFPVLARILSDLGMKKTELGTIALSCAAVDDVTAWCLLALVVGIVESSAESALSVTVLTLGFIVVMFVIVRPAIAARLRRVDDREPTRGAIAVTVVGLLASALLTEAIGVHAVFGAFLFGAVIPHNSKLAHALIQTFENLVTILLLPAFFAFAGMRTEIGLISTWSAWFACGLVIVAATIGKFGGTLVAGHFTGLSWRRAAALGILMNTRGLMQLIVLNIGLDLGIISPTIFTMMVLMALVTTIAATPVLQRLTRVTPFVTYARQPTLPYGVVQTDRVVPRID